ncbi:MAG TPA: MazG nucleotide pyrophosphohydrolase domain-containing protein [Candidatus Hydrogenedentes bacterium]|nr:MazG nucleotide pyrophosphohydrolase domain-containing protein [Candidatus Hydrogenedentota bacterium]HPU98520.1 MazG nucleotide pyrophosphohydrolase domain-containing protein [Candidatus Hydrogenedentota bacterium]
MNNNLPYLNFEPGNESEWFAALCGLVRFLRSPEGCPWDREQGPVDFARYAVKETDEYIEALQQEDHNHAREEFGDALFVLLSSGIAAESRGIFRLEDALRYAHEKMVRRHDHVFGENKATTAEEAVSAWAKIKAQEKKS